jgi:hypothetical protein
MDTRTRCFAFSFYHWFVKFRKKACCAWQHAFLLLVIDRPIACKNAKEATEVEHNFVTRKTLYLNIRLLKRFLHDVLPPFSY